VCVRTSGANCGFAEDANAKPRRVVAFCHVPANSLGCMSRSSFDLVDPLSNNVATKSISRPLDRIGKANIGGLVAPDEDPLVPMFPEQILR
jgi:hypothetical protein